MKPKLRILKSNDDLLRRKCKPIGPITDLHKEMIGQMFALMYENNGIGLAAAQVGWDARIFVINVTESPENELVFINPTIVEQSGDMVEFQEGCLSLPGIYGPVSRNRKVIVTATGLDGNLFTITDEAIAARCMLHEIDHLDGILFIDKASKLYEEPK